MRQNQGVGETVGEILGTFVVVGGWDTVILYIEILTFFSAVSILPKLFLKPPVDLFSIYGSFVLFYFEPIQSFENNVSLLCPTVGGSLCVFFYVFVPPLHDAVTESRNWVSGLTDSLF